MRKFLASLLLLAMFATFASAEMLITADPFGQGRFVVEGAYLMDSNYLNTSGWSMNTLGAYVGYGVTPALDVIVQLGSATGAGLPAGITASGTGYGLIGKYAIVQESKDMPVSVSAGAGYKSLSQTIGTPFGSATNSGTQIMVGAGVSKLLAPFAPYAGLTYRSNSVGGANSTQFDITAGTAIGWSKDGAVYVEYTMQSMTPNAGAGYTQGQLAAGVGYRI